MSDALQALFSRYVSPKKFGESLDPPVSERTVQRWINQPDGLPVTMLPSGIHRVDTVAAAEYLRKRVRQVAPVRQGRRAKSDK